MSEDQKIEVNPDSKSNLENKFILVLSVDGSDEARDIYNRLTTAGVEFKIQYSRELVLEGELLTLRGYHAIRSYALP